MRYRTYTSGLSTWWSDHRPYQVNPVSDFILEQASRLDAFSAYPSAGRKPAVPLAGQLAHESCVRPGPLVLGTAFLKSLTAASDRDRTVSRRSKPSSRTALMGEQPNPWDRLQPQDATSRHRGAKPSRRYGLLGKMSLLSPAYLLSVERRRFHKQPPDHYALLSYLLDL